MKVALIHNPNAGKAKGDGEDLTDILREHGYDPIVLPKDCDPARVAEAEGCGLIVVAGGDGTVRHAALKLVGSRLPVALLPYGTANNICRSLGIEGKPADIVANWDHTTRRKLDIGVAEGPWGKRHFLEGGGIGLLARGISLIEEIDDATSHEFADPEDKLLRDLSVFIALVHELSTVKTRLFIDDREVSDDFFLAEVMNIQNAGPRILLTKRGDSGDGLLEVVAARSTDRERLLHSLHTSLAGRWPDPVLERVSAKKVRMEWDRGDFRLDDEVISLAEFRRSGGTTASVTFSLLAGALDVVGTKVKAAK